MNKYGSSSIILLITILVILTIGYFIITAFTSSIDGTNDYNNITATTVNTTYSIVPLTLMIMAVITIFIIIYYYFSTTDRYRRINKRLLQILEFLDKTTYYFLFGLFVYAIIGTVVTATYLTYRVMTLPGAGEIGFETLKWVLYAVIFFFGTAGVGYLFERYIWKKYQERKKEKEYQENIKQLPKVT